MTEHNALREKIISILDGWSDREYYESVPQIADHIIALMLEAIREPSEVMLLKRRPMTIAEAARAMRKYGYADHSVPTYKWIVFDLHGPEDAHLSEHATEEEAQATCDRLNIIAVLEAVREPSEVMLLAAAESTLEECTDGFWCKKIWHAMIDALIAEVKEAGDA